MPTPLRNIPAQRANFSPPPSEGAQEMHRPETTPPRTSNANDMEGRRQSEKRRASQLLEEVAKPGEAAASTDTLSKEDLLKRLQSHSAKDLQPIENYPGKDEATITVGQGDAHYLSAHHGSLDGLFSGGAGPCLLLVATGKNSEGETEEVGVTHADAYVQKAAFDNFFSPLKKLAKIEVSLFAGTEKLALLALQAADRAGATVIFADAGHQPREEYGVAVDKKGNIYFGHKPTLLSKQVMADNSLERLMAGMLSNQLPLEKQLTFQHH